MSSLRRIIVFRWNTHPLYTWRSWFSCSRQLHWFRIRNRNLCGVCFWSCCAGNWRPLVQLFWVGTPCMSLPLLSLQFQLLSILLVVSSHYTQTSLISPHRYLSLSVLSPYTSSWSPRTHEEAGWYVNRSWIQPGVAGQKCFTPVAAWDESSICCGQWRVWQYGFETDEDWYWRYRTQKAAPKESLLCCKTSSRDMQPQGMR